VPQRNVAFLAVAAYLALSTCGLAQDEPAGTAVPRGTGIDIGKHWPTVRKLRQADAGTVELWLRPDGDAVARERAMLFTLSDEKGADAAGLGLALHKGVPHAIVLGAYLQAPAALPPNRWSHLALTFAGRSAQLWVDGKLVRQTPVAGRWPAGFPVAAVAQDPWGLGRDFSGRLGDVRVSRGVRYTKAFRASPRLAHDPSTVHLLEGSKARPAPLPPLVEAKFGSVRAFYFRDESPVEMAPLRGAPPSAGKAYALAALPLVLTEPCVVTTGGRSFHLDREGLYRIGNLSTKETANVILYRGDLWRLAGHLCRLQVHGWRHDDEGVGRWTERARKGRLAMSCGNIARFVAYHLAARGHRARVVNLLTLEEHNGYDDGHVLLEVFDPREKRWVAFDPDMKCRFKHAGRYLDLGEAVALFRKGAAVELELFCQPAIDACAEEGGSREHAQYSLLFEWAFRDARARQAWYRRMMQVPIVDGAAGALTEADGPRMRARGLARPVPWGPWRRAAYGR
jgi:hypothetical protein